MTGNIDIPLLKGNTDFSIGLTRETNMSVVPVADVLQGRVAVDSEVTVRGWAVSYTHLTLPTTWNV